MQTKKIAIFLSLALAIFSIPLYSVHNAQAFLTGGGGSGTLSVTISNIQRDFSPPSGGTVDVLQAGTTFTISVIVQATNVAYQRNVTIGFEGDWMSTYSNASIITLTAGQTGQASISIAAPSQGSPTFTHNWNIQVWDGPASGTVSGCATGNAENNSPGSKSCFTESNFFLGFNSLAFYTSDQYSAAQAFTQSSTAIAFASTSGSSAAAGQLAQAKTEQALGDTSWNNGDYSGAKTHFQNALNDANAATNTVVNQGGGLINADIVSAIMAGTGSVLIGVGILLGGFGAFMYFRRRPKA
jgi:hypothetical protein